MQEQVGGVPELPEIQLAEKYFTECFIYECLKYKVSNMYILQTYLALTSQTPPQASSTIAANCNIFMTSSTLR